MFLYALREASLRYGLDIHVYVLMTNHVHMMVTPINPTALPRAMQALGSRYVSYFNERCRRTGTLFESRYRSLPITDEAYWMTCMRYIELNPVRAGLVTAPDAYRWSSYRAHAMGRPDLLLTDHSLYLRLGNTSADRHRSWQAVCAQAIPEGELQEIRAAINTGRAANQLVLPEPGVEPVAQP